MRAIRAADVIIVGGGSAGCVLAERLSADPGRSVILLESGPDLGRFDQVPASARRLDALFTRSAWTYDTTVDVEPTGESKELKRGRLMGGSSAINAANALIARRWDFDGWDQELWSPGDVGRCFDSLLASASATGADDPATGLTLERPRRTDLSPVAEAFVRAQISMGVPWVDDLNDWELHGVGAVPRNVREGQRQSAAAAFLDPVRDRPNLRIVADAHVVGLVWQGDRVGGVVLRSGERLVSSRVVVAAGVYGSPQLLQHSGIGDSAALEAQGISVRHHLPGVGGGLQDHPLALVDVQGIDPAGSSAVLEVMALVPGDAGRAELAVAPARKGDGTLAIGVGLMQVTHAGSVSVRGPGTDALDVRLPMWSGADARHLGAGVRKVLDVLLSRMGGAASMVPSTPRGREGTEWDQWLTSITHSFHHGTGTCRMGASDDPTAVLDWTGRVLGVDGLHVVDASSIPGVPSTPTNLTTMMVAARCSELLAAQDAR